MFDTGLGFILFIIFIALVFDFYNGVNDAANSVATIVSTRVLTPKLAVVWAAIFNFIAAFGFGVKVATTIGKGIITTDVVNEYLILTGLLGAISWTAIATHWGLPISVSHSLIGGIIGSGIAKAGISCLIRTGIYKIFIFIFLSPIIGMILGLILITISTWLIRKNPPSRVDRYFRVFQLFSAAGYSLGHGTNDAQKTMGIIALLLFSKGLLGESFFIPWWVIIMCHLVIALGTLIGGWKVIKTLGLRVTKLRPIDGFSAETAAATTLLLTALGGIPVSTTHTITGAIIGVGSVKRFSAVRWGVAFDIFLAWIFTIPITSLFSWFFYKVFNI